MLLTLINIFISDSHRVILKEKEKNEKGRLEWISSLILTVVCPFEPIDMYYSHAIFSYLIFMLPLSSTSTIRYELTYSLSNL